MWWKLIALGVATVAIVFGVIPIRTHAVAVDLSNGPPPPPAFTLENMVAGVYLTPGSVVLILLILAVAGFIALKIVRR